MEREEAEQEELGVAKVPGAPSKSYSSVSFLLLLSSLPSCPEFLTPSPSPLLFPFLPFLSLTLLSPLLLFPFLPPSLLLLNLSFSFLAQIWRSKVNEPQRHHIASIDHTL